VTDFADSVIDRLERAYAESTGSEGVETVDLEAETNVILKLLRTSGEFIIEFFLSDSLDMEVPQFHEEIWGLLTDQEKERVLLAIPRGHAKTTLAKLCVIWYWLFTSHRFCVYLSNTAAIAKGACRDIIEWLSHPNFIQIFGVIKMVKHSDNEGLWIFDLPTGNGRIKRCILRALGQGQQMRGINIDNQRPDLAIVDDVEDNDNTASETQQKKLDQWMYGPFLQALAQKRKVLWLGNMLSKTSLLSRQSRNPAWNPVVFGCLVKGPDGFLRPLWPQRWTIEQLMESFREYKAMGLVETWMCEMMNMPGHGENGFTADQLHYAPAPDPSEIRAAWITIDPAFGLKAHNDESSIAVHVIPRGSNIPVTLTPVHGRWTETQLYHRTLEIAAYWNAWTWGIEAVAAQKVLLTLFDMLQTVVGLPGRAVFVPLTAGRGDPKIARIRAFVSLLADKKWAIAEDDVDLTTQILGLDLRKKDQEDDIADSAAYGPSMWEEFQGLIEHQFAANDDDPCEAEYGTEVAGV
jgi:hypothetical protein